MVCESDLFVDGEPVLSSLLEDSVPPSAPNLVPERPAKQDCQAYGDVDCDLNPPEGSPESPRPITAKRSIGALASLDDRSAADTGRRLLETEHSGQPGSGYAADIFRPPRRW